VVDLFFVPAKNDPMAAMPSAMPAWPFLPLRVRPAALSTKAWRGDRETGPQSDARSCRNAGRPAGGTLK
jgi:hypothetical protein